MFRSERVEFPGHSGEKLAARLERPVGEARGFALFAHCFSCSKDVLAAKRIAEGLAEKGIAVLRFDFTGLGVSEGDFANTNFTTNVQDLLAAARWLGETHGGPDLLIGHSLGGAAVVVAALDLPSVKAVATIGAPADAEHVLHQFAPRIAEIEAEGSAEVTLAGRPFRINRTFVEDVRGAKVRDAARELRRPLLVMHAPTDDVVGVENATGLFLAAKHPKSFVSLDRADHLLTKAGDAAFVADVLAGWAGRYLPERELAPRPKPPRDEDSVLVTEAGGRYTNWAVSGTGHALLVDEPDSLGGRDLGPDPYTLIEAALGACTSITLRMYADRKGWALENVAVTVKFERQHGPDCEHCEDGKPVDVFHRAIRLSGELDEAQRVRLMEIADKCPVHRTLETAGKVITVAEA